MLTTALRPFSNSKLCSPSSVTQSPLPLLVASTTTHLRPRACATFCVERRVESSTRWKSFRSSPIVFTPMDPDFVPDSSGWLQWSWSRPRAWGVRKRKPRRLRQEGAVGVAIMTSDTHSLWHADMIRSAAARPRGPKRATGVFGLVMTTWRLASADAGRNEALGLHELECRRLQAGTLS